MTIDDTKTNSFLYSQPLYTNGQLQRQQPLPPLTQNQQHPYNNNKNNNNAQSWEEHVQQQNPFQTAREYAAASSNTTNSNKNSNHSKKRGQPQQEEDSWNNQHNTNNRSHNNDPVVVQNPYYSKQQQQQQQYRRPLEEEDDTNTPTTVQVPVIRDSLKRKFQPPKRGTVADGTKTGNRNNNNSGGSSSLNKTNSNYQNNNNTTTTTKKNSTSNKSSSDPNNSDDNNDDDDLPEELKRFGKKLVEQIQNEIMDQGDNITFDDIAGLRHAKETIQEIVIWPMKRPDLFTGLRRTPNGLLLFGPPGTGKTLIGKAIAHESGACFFSISSSSLTSKWIGEGEKLVRTLFAVAAYQQPSVVFIDEIDSLLTQRKADDNEASRRIKTEFLVQLDGTGTSGQGRVLVIGATNRPQELDEAARRRFVKRLYIPLPNESDRACLLQVLAKKNENTLVPNDINKLASDTEGFSGADLSALCSDAAMGPIRQLGRKALETAVADIPPISYKHFRQALRSMHPSVSPADIAQYEDFDNTFGSKRAPPASQDDDDDNYDDNDDDNDDENEEEKKENEKPSI